MVVPIRYAHRPSDNQARAGELATRCRRAVVSGNQPVEAPDEPAAPELNPFERGPEITEVR